MIESNNKSNATKTEIPRELQLVASSLKEAQRKAIKEDLRFGLKPVIAKRSAHVKP
jgi:hypothetical protein